MQVTIQQLERGLELADKAGDVQAAKAFSAELAKALDMRAETPGIGKSLVRGAIGGSLGLFDLGTQVAGYPARKLYEAAGGTVPSFFQPSNAAQVAQEYTGTDQPPVTAGERAAELLGSSLAPGGAAIGLAAKAGKFIPALASEAAALSGSVVGRELGVQAGGPGSTSELVGMMAGGFAPTALPAVSRGLSAPRVPYTSRKGQEETLSAFERQEVPATLADITDQAYLQRGSSHMPGGYGVNKGVRQDQQQAMESAVNRLAPDVDEVAAGQAIHKGIQGYVTDVFKPTAAKLAKRLDQKIPKDTPVELTKTKALFAQIHAEKGPFQGSLGVPALTKMEGEVKKAVEAAKPRFELGPSLRGEKQTQEILDFKTLRRMRSAIGTKLANFDLISDIPRADLKRLYGAMSEDIKIAAAQAGADATAALRRLNSYYKKGITRIDDFLEPIAKKASPEEMQRAVFKSTKDSPTRIKALSHTLKPEQREVAISAMLRRFGKPTSGVQTPDYTFSPETFLTNLNKVDDENFAQLAKGTKYQGSQHLKDLKLIAGRLREVDAVLKNPSQTAETLLAGGALGGAGIAGALGSVSALAAIGAVVGGSYTLSRLMTNPKFVNWVVRGQKIGPEKYMSHLARLATLMEGESDDDREAVGEFIKQSMGE